jgi:hypothetical protein
MDVRGLDLVCDQAASSRMPRPGRAVGGWPGPARHRGLGYLAWRSPLHAREGPTPYLVRDGSYFLPAAREIRPCCPVLSPRDTEPGIAEALAKDAPGRTGHGHLMARSAHRGGIARTSWWSTGGLPAGRPGGTDPPGRLRAASALFAGTSLALSVDARRTDGLAAPRGVLIGVCVGRIGRAASPRPAATATRPDCARWLHQAVTTTLGWHHKGSAESPAGLLAGASGPSGLPSRLGGAWLGR